MFTALLAVGALKQLAEWQWLQRSWELWYGIDGHNLQIKFHLLISYFDGLVQDGSISIANALETLQS